jgi:hypothetical protein
MQVESLIEKIKRLSPEHLTEVEDFVDFLVERENRRLVAAAMKLSEEALRQVWDNDEDSVYDQL